MSVRFLSKWTSDSKDAADTEIAWDGTRSGPSAQISTRQPSASATCRAEISAARSSARSASVRATRRMRPTPRAVSLPEVVASRSAAFSIGDKVSGSLGVQEYCALDADALGRAGLAKIDPKLAPLHRSMDPAYPGYDGKPIEWVRVHKAPDYVYFKHSAQVNRGISCQSCHGDVNKMEVVYQAESLSMGWCLECHRAPEKHLRPLEEVYNLNYSDEDAKKYVTDGSVKTTLDLGKKLKETFNVHPKTSCATCHH